MKGKLIQVNISQGGIPKKAIPEAKVTFDRVEGDSWNYHEHGGPQRAICLYSIELIEDMKKSGFELFPGAMGENFTTQGLDYHQIRLGDIFQVGSEVQIKITQIRVPCGSLDIYGKGIPDLIYDEDVKNGDTQSGKWGKSGYKCSVLKEGIVRPGDEIIKIG